MTFQTRITEILTEQNLKQADLCRMTGIPTSLMSNYANGKASPSLDNATAMATALGVTLDYLVGRKPDLSKTQANLLNTFGMLNGEGQNLLMAILDSLRLSHAKERKSNSTVVQKNSGGTNFLSTGGNNSYSVVTS